MSNQTPGPANNSFDLTRDLLTLHFKDSGGNQDANNDYSGVGNEVDFIIKPPANLIYRVLQISIKIVDTLVTNSKYGGININPATFIGLKLAIREQQGENPDISDPVKRSLITKEENLTTNHEVISAFGLNFSPYEDPGGGGPTMINFLYDLYNQGMDFILDGRTTSPHKPEYIAFTLNDDFSSTIEHQFHAKVRVFNKEIGQGS